MRSSRSGGGLLRLKNVAAPLGIALPSHGIPWGESVVGLMLGWFGWLAGGLWWSFAPEAASRFYAAFGQRRWTSPEILRPLGWMGLVIFVFGEGFMLFSLLTRHP